MSEYVKRLNRQCKRDQDKLQKEIMRLKRLAWRYCLGDPDREIIEEQIRICERRVQEIALMYIRLIRGDPVGLDQLDIDTYG